MKYRKTAPISPIQFNKAGDHPAVLEDPTSPTGFGIFTLENTARKFEVTPGDWIVTGSAGEHYAIKDSIFRETYEPVPDTSVAALGYEVPEEDDWQEAKQTFAVLGQHRHIGLFLYAIGQILIHQQDESPGIEMKVNGISMQVTLNPAYDPDEESDDFED